MSCDCCSAKNHFYPYFSISDLDNAEVVFIDARENKVIDRTRVTPESTPYPIDMAEGQLFVSTRAVDSVDVLDPISGKNKGIVSLQHRPRSGTRSFENLFAIAGANKVAVTVIDAASHEKELELVIPTSQTPSDFGGGLYCGHPRWINPTQFFLPDRAQRKVHLIDVEHSQPLDSINTSTSVHMIMAHDAWNYGVLEGNLSEGIKMGLCRFRVENGKFVNYSELLISNGGGHHGLVYPGRNQIWLPSSDGYMHLIDTTTFSVSKSLPAGAGAGHPNFNLEYNVAACLNHKGGSITFYDSTEGHEKVLTTIQVNDENPGSRNNISHTSWFSQDGRYFYFIDAIRGYFYTVDGFKHHHIKLKNRLRLYRKDWRHQSGKKGYFIQGTGWAGKSRSNFPLDQASVM